MKKTISVSLQHMDELKQAISQADWLNATIVYKGYNLIDTRCLHELLKNGYNFEINSNNEMVFNKKSY